VAPLGLAWECIPLADAAARTGRLPLNHGGVQSHDIPLEPAEKAVYTDVNVIKRLVTVGNEQVVLTIIDGTRNRHAVHDPGFCFRGAGWEITGRQSLPLEKGSAQLLRLQQGGETAEAVYWFTDGKEQFDSPQTYWWKTALRRMTFGHSGSEPVLVVLATTGAAPDWPALLKSWPDLQEM